MIIDMETSWTLGQQCTFLSSLVWVSRLSDVGGVVCEYVPISACVSMTRKPPWWVLDLGKLLGRGLSGEGLGFGVRGGAPSGATISCG